MESETQREAPQEGVIAENGGGPDKGKDLVGMKEEIELRYKVPRKNMQHIPDVKPCPPDEEIVDDMVQVYEYAAHEATERSGQ